LNSKELEELIYEYGHVMHQIGKAETNDRVGMKDYNKLIAEKEKLVAKFESYFKGNSKIARTLNIA